MDFIYDRVFDAKEREIEARLTWTTEPAEAVAKGRIANLGTEATIAEENRINRDIFGVYSLCKCLKQTLVFFRFFKVNFKFDSSDLNLNDFQLLSLETVPVTLFQSYCKWPIMQLKWPLVHMFLRVQLLLTSLSFKN
jgi:hypothetical protein